VFTNNVDTSASNSRYLELDLELYTNRPNRLEAKKWILTAIKEHVCKNNIVVANKIVRKTSKKAYIFKVGYIVTVAILAKLR
jgi:hypothetical protein